MGGVTGVKWSSAPPLNSRSPHATVGDRGQLQGKFTSSHIERDTCMLCLAQCITVPVTLKISHVLISITIHSYDGFEVLCCKCDHSILKFLRYHLARRTRQHPSISMSPYATLNLVVGNQKVFTNITLEHQLCSKTCVS